MSVRPWVVWGWGLGMAMAAVAQCPICVVEPPPDPPPPPPVQVVEDPGQPKPQELEEEPSKEIGSKSQEEALASKPKGESGLGGLGEWGWLRLGVLGSVQPTSFLSLGALLDFPVQSPQLLLSVRFYSRPRGVALFGGAINSLAVGDRRVRGFLARDRLFFWALAAWELESVRLSGGGFWEGPRRKLQPLLVAEWKGTGGLRFSLTRYGREIYPSLRLLLGGGWGVQGSYLVSRGQVAVRLERRVLGHFPF